MLPAIPNPLMQMWFHWYCRFALRKFFHRIQLFGDVAFEPDRSTIYVVNHCCFWDALVMNFLIRTCRRQPAFCMADLEQVKRHPFFRRVGAFSVDRSNPRDGMRAIQYATHLLGSSPCAVVIFPQGKIEPADKRPLGFERGIDRLVSRVPVARVVIVALRYEFWMNQRPELLIDMTLARDLTSAAMEQQLTERLDFLTRCGRGFRSGKTILQGRKSISDWTAIRAGGDTSSPPLPPIADPPVRSDRA